MSEQEVAVETVRKPKAVYSDAVGDMVAIKVEDIDITLNLDIDNVQLRHEAAVQLFGKMKVAINSGDLPNTGTLSAKAWLERPTLRGGFGKPSIPLEYSDLRDWLIPRLDGRTEKGEVAFKDGVKCTTTVVQERIEALTSGQLVGKAFAKFRKARTAEREALDAGEGSLDL